MYHPNNWTDEDLCSRNEESLVDLGSSQAQVVIGVRRCGKSTLCMQTLASAGVKFAYADFDDERLAGLDTVQLNDILENGVRILIKPVYEWCIEMATEKNIPFEQQLIINEQ